MKTDVHTPPALSKDEMMQWLVTLHTAIGYSKARMAALIGVSPVTISRWYNGDMPTDWWWRTVMTQCIELCVERLRHLAATTKRQSQAQIYKDKIRAIERRLERMPSDTYFTRQTMLHGDSMRRTREFLIKKLRPGKKVPYADLTRDFGTHGVSTKTLGRAADSLGVQRGKEGFGGPTWWRLPRERHPETLHEFNTELGNYDDES